MTTTKHIIVSIEEGDGTAIAEGEFFAEVYEADGGGEGVRTTFTIANQIGEGTGSDTRDAIIQALNNCELPFEDGS